MRYVLLDWIRSTIELHCACHLIRLSFGEGEAPRPESGGEEGSLFFLYLPPHKRGCWCFPFCFFWAGAAFPPSIFVWWYFPSSKKKPHEFTGASCSTTQKKGTERAAPAQWEINITQKQRNKSIHFHQILVQSVFFFWEVRRG